MGFRSTRTTQRSERHIKVANGVQAEVEAIGDVSLELVNGFMLVLRDVLFVPSLEINLISVSRLDKDGYGCHFENGKCELWFDNNCVGDAFLHNELYVLSMRDKVYFVYDANVNVIASLSVNVNRKRKRTQVESLKLWHCRLGHISRGRMERLVKNEILPPLEFSDLEQCIECIKGKFVKQIKKGAK